MCAVSRDRRGRYAAGAAVAIACVVLALTWFIDHKLNESAENQVIAFTEQAASNISDRMFMVQNAVGAFTVQSSNPADLVSALSALRERHGFSHAAAVGMDGTGFLDDGSPFSTGDLVQQETALSQQVASYSDTFVNDEGVRVRLAQEPLYLDGVLVGALYVQIPLDLFTMPADLDMFDGRGYFMLFEAKTGEILVEPGEETKTPISGSMTLYDFLDEAARYEIPTAFDSSDEASAALLAVQAQQGCDMDGLKGSVARGNTGLTTARPATSASPPWDRGGGTRAAWCRCRTCAPKPPSSRQRFWSWCSSCSPAFWWRAFWSYRRIASAYARGTWP